LRVGRSDALAGITTNAPGTSLTFIDHNFSTSGNFTNDGTLIVDPSTFTVHGNSIQDASGIQGAHIDGLTLGTRYDQFIITGIASLAGQLDITFDPGFTPAIGQSFEIISYASETGQFSSIDVSGLPSNLGYTLDYGPTGISLDIKAASGPEPDSMTLLLTGSACLSLGARLMRRTRRRQRSPRFGRSC
jgi:hypothetical protein